MFCNKDLNSCRCGSRCNHCVYAVIWFLSILVTFTVALIIGAVASFFVIKALGAIIVLAIVFALLALIALFLVLCCCRKRDIS